MEANTFITNLKANGVDSDKSDLAKVFNQYSEIITSLPAKDRSSFSLNVLCIFCRNLEKVPRWRDKINIKELLRLSIECVRHTRTLSGPDQVKTLACIYHLHRHVVKQSSLVPPELILKLSFMPFEYEEENLLNEYYKTYWSILADRITYIERLKAKKMPILKLLPKLIDDVTKVIKMYDTVQFCSNLLTFLVKKLNYIYNDSVKDLSEAFGKIFDCILKKDLKQFKKITESDVLDIYVKLNDCLCIITENSLRNNDSIMENVTRVCISLLGHRPDMFHCFQTFYLNSFCCIFNDKTDVNLVENILNSLPISCETTEKLGYERLLYYTYPFISQLFRLYLERIVNSKNENFTEALQENSLRLMLFLLEKLKKTKQLLKCENCNIKSGLHDGLRLSFHIKNFITTSTDRRINISSILPKYYEIIEQQYAMLEELKRLGCVNQEKCFRKLQTDIHNTAILLNKSQYYEYSIKLFEIYLKNELRNIKNDVELKNISRALYNKSICELDCKLYEESLKNAYLSLIFALPEGLSSEKYMSLVMDIKAKQLKSSSEDSDGNQFQMLSVLEICKLLYDDSAYGDLKPFITNLDFGVLLKHEFSMYAKLWPSIAPIAGVWNSLNNIVNGTPEWVKVNKEESKWSLYNIVLETPTVVRTIHNDCYRAVVQQLLGWFDEQPPSSLNEKIVQASLLFLQTEYDVADASEKYGWKDDENSSGDGQVLATVEQEQRALEPALRAAPLLADALAALDEGPGEGRGARDASAGRGALRLCAAAARRLLHARRALPALRLARACCRLARLAADRESHLRNFTTLLQHTHARNPSVDALVCAAAQDAAQLMKNPHSLDTALCFLCELAIYYKKIGSVGFASRLVRAVQARLLAAHEGHSDVNLQLSLGRLLAAQMLVAPAASGALGPARALQRHYLARPDTSPRWTARCYRSLTAGYHASQATTAAVDLCRSLRLPRRAAAAAQTRRHAAVHTASVYARVADVHGSAQVTIDNLKYIIGIQTSTETPLHATQALEQKHFTPKRTNLETMLDSMLKKTQLSPTLSCISIPAFQIPEFLTHAHTCTCYACDIPECVIIACQITHLEAATYFRAKEFQIARNYFNGALKSFGLAELKMRNVFDVHRKRNFEDFVVGLVEENYESEFRSAQLEFLIELSFFELAQNEFEKCDDTIVRINEILSECKTIDGYLRNEIANLMIASAQVRKITMRTQTGLENELESLKLSPAKVLEPQKTPETKKELPKITSNRIVKDEEVPKKFKGVKLKFANLEEDEATSEKVEKATRSKNSQFKIPVPITAKPVLEKMTPLAMRSKPDIVIQQPSLEMTPKSESNIEFFTPCQSTPAEQFFTPMTSLKTYSKRIVKNLESEFSTPKGKDDKLKLETKNTRSKVETGSIKSIKDKRSLKRATSPGKLEPEKPATRSRRIRQPLLTDNKK